MNKNLLAIGADKRRTGYRSILRGGSAGGCGDRPQPVRPVVKEKEKYEAPTMTQIESVDVICLRSDGLTR